MILDKEEVDARLESPLNLLNRLKKITSIENRIVSIPQVVEESSSSRSDSHAALPPSADELIDNLEDKLATARCYSGAKQVLSDSINKLSERLNEVDSPIQLSRIATDMGKIVKGFDESRKDRPSTAIPIIYRPVMLTENNFQIIQAND